MQALRGGAGTDVQSSDRLQVCISQQSIRRELELEGLVTN